MKVKVEGVHNPLHGHDPLHGAQAHAPAQEDPSHLSAAPAPLVSDELHAPGPRPIGTLMVIAILLLVTIAFWMMVLGVQQGRA